MQHNLNEATTQVCTVLRNIGFECSPPPSQLPYESATANN